MGFTVTEPLNILRFDIDVPNAYVTLRGSCILSKNNFLAGMPMGGMSMPNSVGVGSYRISGRYQIYATQSAEEPLLTQEISTTVAEPPADPMSVLYAHLKSQERFEGKTLTDC